MTDAGEEQQAYTDKEEVKKQLALLKPKAHSCATLAFKMAAAGVKDLKTDSRTAANLEKSGALIVWLELLAFSVYLTDRLAKSRLRDTRHIYMDLLLNFVMEKFPEEAAKHGRKGLRSEKGWQDDVAGTLSTRCLQYFSLEQGAKGKSGPIESLPPDALFTEFGGVIAHNMGVPEDDAIIEIIALRSRTGFGEILKEFNPEVEGPS